MTTTKEAIKILSREKECVQQALQKCADGSGYVSPDGMIRAADYVEACSVALAALRAQQERADQKPLTLDELRQMDGEPVWVKADHYGVYADIIHIMGREDGESYVKFKINWRLQENGYGKTWLAYLRKPKEEV